MQYSVINFMTNVNIKFSEDTECLKLKTEFKVTREGVKEVSFSTRR